MTIGTSHIRAARLLGIIGFLVRRGTVTTANQIAGEFAVNKRSVLRDIAAIRALGVEVHGEAGVGYSISRGVAADWVCRMLFNNPAAIHGEVQANLFERRFGLEVTN